MFRRHFYGVCNDDGDDDDDDDDDDDILTLAHFLGN